MDRAADPASDLARHGCVQDLDWERRHDLCRTAKGAMLDWLAADPHEGVAVFARLRIEQEDHRRGRSAHERLERLRQIEEFAAWRTGLAEPLSRHAFDKGRTDA